LAKKLYFDEGNTIFTDGNGNFGFKVRLSERIFFDEKNGYLYCNDVVLGNTGVQYYKGYELGFADSKSTIEVHREEADVFDEISMDSLKGIPVTLRHPKRLLDSATTSDHIKGATYGEPRRDGDNIVCDLVIYDSELIDLVAPEGQDGERHLSEDFRDLSLGYRSKLVPIGMKTNTYKQTNIHYNHVAVLEAGRQINAMIRDGDNPEFENKEEGKQVMSILSRIIGKKVNRNDETKDVVITDEDVEIEVNIEDAKRVVSEYEHHSIEKRESYDDPKKTIVTENASKTIVTEEDNDEKKTIFDSQTEKEKEIKEVEKDKLYFQTAIMDAMKLPDGEIKVSLIADLNKEFADTFPAPQPKEVVIKDTKQTIKPVDNEKEIEKEFKDGEKPQTDYVKFEAESRTYYRKLTDPFAHASWKEFNDNYNAEVRKGRADIM